MRRESWGRWSVYEACAGDVSMFALMASEHGEEAYLRTSEGSPVLV